MWRRVALLAGALAALCGCEANYPTIPSRSDVVARVVLQYRFPTVFVALGSTSSLYMYAVSPDGGYTDVTAQTQYFSSDLTVVRPTSGGLFTGVAPGAAEIVASYNGFTASTPVSVRPLPRPYPYIEMSSGGPGAAGGTATVRAILWQGPSQGQSIGAQGAWTSSDPGVATVTGGMVETFKVGTAVITVTFNGLSESIYMPVGPRY
jgi:hypothetical protein